MLFSPHEPRNVPERFVALIPKVCTRAFSYIQTAAQIDLLFTDVQMPGSMDGVGLARRIGTGYPSIRIILTSGNTVLPAVANAQPSFSSLANPSR